MRGTAVLYPLGGFRAHSAALGSNDESRRIGMQRLIDEALAHFRSVGIGGVDEVDAKLDRAAQHPARLGRIPRLAPDARAGETHGAETHAVHQQVAAYLERAGGRRRCPRPSPTRLPASSHEAY